MSSAQHRSGDTTLTKPDHGRTIRLDIEGMRTIAVGSVLIAHAGVPFAAGGFVGVDVFFVLSGFLITGLLAREVSRTGRVSLGNFWARRMKRLLPASATVLVFSTLVTYLYLPITQREDFGGDIRSAALYVVNWRLAARGVDYLAEDVGQSPVQHYWSLAVEEQFYVVWPILMLVIGLLAARRWKLGAFAVLGVATVASFAYSVQQTADSPATAYFVSTTRIWELGIGALLALAATRVERLPSVLRAIGGWLGIALIAFAVFVFDEKTTWPGTNALVPTVGAALMIASGLRSTPGSPQRLLSLPPMVWIGGLSYSIYLWHWPILVAAQAKYPDLQLRWVVLLMIASIVPAYLSNRFIENPVRFGTFFKPTGRAIGLGLALTAVGVGVGWGLSVSATAGGVTEADTAASPGAAALLDPANKDVDWSAIRSVERMRPLATEAVDDRPGFYDDGSGCQVDDGIAEPKACTYGDTSSQRTVVIVGDSKMAQWQPTFATMAKREGWKLVQLTKSSCTFADVEFARENRVDCRAWGRTVLKDILDLKPDLVIESHRFIDALPPGRTDDADSTEEAMVNGLTSYWRTITDAGIPLVTLLDNPSPPNAPVYECVAAAPDDLSSCSFELAGAVKASGAVAQRKAAAEVPGVGIMDMTSTICPDGDRCAAVIGNVLVYRQGTHLTKTFIDTAERQLSAALYDASDGAFGTTIDTP
ncbi:acyltransferase family protein [Aeromicrobium fastidiosum]|uniref:Acyltransferase n=1 Tax=Aeromicrobium fastidiosum TaxID=52699 RepID=A0A641AKS9_9ACTN|nr:acyltransferase family protein [Aeromicrobium fastidiosum]KAA1374920.1 acyltransferase [Aeromicrobium fastidiosum]MBP2390508.1 peptidoglycan/LPS O-acetylase OafA/YrhL [Aeromicrobium fastidiosum]